MKRVSAWMSTVLPTMRNFIAGGVTLSLMKGEESALQFYLASALSVLFGRALGATVVGIDPSAGRRAIAEKLGAVLTLDPAAVTRFFGS